MKRRSWAKEQIGCKCGAPSVDRVLITHYRKKDGIISTYIQKEKRCQNCINKSKHKINQHGRRKKSLITDGAEAPRDHVFGY